VLSVQRSGLGDEEEKPFLSPAHQRPVNFAGDAENREKEKCRNNGKPT